MWFQVCTKCKGVKEANMPLYCRCAGDFDLTFSAKVCTLIYIQFSAESIRSLPIWFCSHSFFFTPFLPFKELLRADHSVSEHSSPLQHELPGGDHRLAAGYEPTHQPERSIMRHPPAEVQHSLSCIWRLFNLGNAPFWNFPSLCTCSSALTTSVSMLPDGV